MIDQNVYIGRQPILTTHGEIYAYELLFRSGGENMASFSSDLNATARVIVNTIVNFGVNKLVGGKIAFINFDDTVIKNKIYTSLDKNKFVFEILETTNLDAETVGSVYQMKEGGYRFALDDFVLDDNSFERFRPVLDVVDFIKIDVRLNTKEMIDKKLALLKNKPAKLLAEKVETQEEYHYCRKKGFDYFQGYYFAKPTIVKGKSIEPDKMAVLDLVGRLNDNPDLDTKDIEEIFKQHPDMTINLLKFINSAAFFTRNKINSVRQAIALLGINKLMQWLLLMLYAGPQTRTVANPLFTIASQRAKFMELLVKNVTTDKVKEMTDEAYLVGLLSLLDVLFQVPLETILGDMNMAPEIYEAIIRHKGVLGRLLLLVEKAEMQNTMEIDLILQELEMSLSEFSDAAVESFSYSEMMESE